MIVASVQAKCKPPLEIKSASGTIIASNLRVRIEPVSEAPLKHAISQRSVSRWLALCSRSKNETRGAASGNTNRAEHRLHVGCHAQPPCAILLVNRSEERR